MGCVGMTREPEQDTRKLEGNLKAYTIYLLGREGYFWMPVFFLYFSAHLPIAQVLLLEAVYYIAVVLLEVPSGWASDRFGRRPTLVLSSLAMFASYVLFFHFPGDWGVWAVAQVLLAAGLALASGTDTSLLYDSLAALGRADEYGDREAKLGRLSSFVMAAGALIGGASSLLDARWAYGVSALFITLSLGASVAMVEPERAHRAQKIRMQLLACARLLRRPAVGWLFFLGGVFVMLSHVPYEFYQPYIALEERMGGDFTPLISGVHASLAMFLAGWAAGASMWFVRRSGTRRVLIAGGLLQVGMIGVMGMFLHPVIVLLLLARGVPSALTRAPLRQALMPRIGESVRATFLSLLSLFGRLLFAGVLALLAFAIPDGVGESMWGVLSARLLLASGVGVLAMVVMLLWAGAIRGSWEEDGK